jgi:uncharacterized surface protein with fasciclin (FAS1) repeats
MRPHPVRGTHVRRAAIAASIAFAAAGCGKAPPIPASPTGGAGPLVSVTASPTPSTSHSPSPAPTSLSPSTSSTAPATRSLVGADCGMIPLTGNGSIRTMRTKKAIIAASSNPQLSVFVAAVRTTRLDTMLNSRHSYTLIIPANSAFASLSSAQITHLRKPGVLTKIISYHAVKARLSPQQFRSSARPATLGGKTLPLSKIGPIYKVNGATVLCGNIRTANATIYIVNEVLQPPR